MRGKNDGDGSVAERCGRMADEYDRKNETEGWYGPEVAFGLAYAFVRPGESVLDIGVGTGLGSVLFHKAGLRVYGMDLSADMLRVCEEKRFTEGLKMHDLVVEPYPYAAASLDHAVCVGVLNHFEDLGPVFRETSRILRDNGVFAFVVSDRASDEESRFEVEHGYARATMFRHSKSQIDELLVGTGYVLVRECAFSLSGPHRQGQSPPLKAYVARRLNRPTDRSSVLP